MSKKIKIKILESFLAYSHTLNFGKDIKALSSLFKNIYDKYSNIKNMRILFYQSFLKRRNKHVCRKGFFPH